MAALFLVGVVLAIAPQDAPLPLRPAPEAVSRPAPETGPRTVPESSGHTATSRADDVQRFCEALATLPHGDRVKLETAGTTHGGRPQLLARISLAPASTTPRLRALVIGNIHAGEVEGKEALQVLLREFANGAHEDVLQRCDLWFLPIYNVDGNEKTGATNRQGQNGPRLTGERANAQGLDLNRDFVKVDAPETRTLLRLFREVDPHLFVDLHTTNGSYHGYHLTYAPSLSPNVDPDLRHLSRRLLDDAQATMRNAHRFATFDYGNFETRDWDGGGGIESPTGERGWYTYDHRARYGINYFGLRNRIGILSEAYSYDDFATRIQATRAFVLCLLQALVARGPEIAAACERADSRLTSPTEPVSFGFDTTFGEPESLDVLTSEVDQVPGEDGAPPRYVRKGQGRAERMPVVRSFRAREQLALPMSWAILDASADVRDRLQHHGIQFTRLDAPRSVRAERFVVTQKKKPKRPYQGHQELVLGGNWLPAEDASLPAGTLLVSAHQPLARLAATLLEPRSEDSLSTWNFFEATTGDHYPVLRVQAP